MKIKHYIINIYLQREYILVYGIEDWDEIGLWFCAKDTTSCKVILDLFKMRIPVFEQSAPYK